MKKEKKSGRVIGGRDTEVNKYPEKSKIYYSKL